ncbi:MAG: MBG domain-containing protein [Bacteroidales bacterium]|nr:MBG domain-containing protein [Bacteroidales bacterium]
MKQSNRTSKKVRKHFAWGSRFMTLLGLTLLFVAGTSLTTLTANPTGGKTTPAGITVKSGDTYHTVRFYEADNVTPLSQIIVENGTITVLPEAPFKEGWHFVKWNTAADGTGDDVIVGYPVTGDLDVYAIFSEIKIYKVEAKYWYENNAGNPYYFESQIFEFEDDGNEYIITCPTNVNQDTSLTGDNQNPIYYPSEPTITIPQSELANATYNEQDGVYVLDSRSVQYVPYTATYDFVYLLKNLNGNGYTEIEREDDIHGVLGSTVTATVKEYPYANFDYTLPVAIDAASGIEIPVYYNRKTMTLTYNTQGGSYMAPQTGLYGSTVSVTTTQPTRTGYTFQGWYDAPEGGNSVSGDITLDEDKTLYAHWQGQPVNYTIVYMFEKYNDAGTVASFVYDNSETGTAQVGTTVHANDNGIPDKTRAGWEKDNTRNANSSVVVAADGSSILYVYYKLREYTLTFNRNNRGEIVKPDGTTTTSTYSINVKIGQDISGLWPSAQHWYYYFMGWQKNGQGTRYVTKQFIMNEDLLPGNNGNSVTYYASWDNNAYQRTVNYYLENADDNGYTRSETYSQTYYSNSSNLNPKEIVGYTYDHSQNSGNTFNFYYKRNTNPIDYYYGGSKRQTINDVKFDATITGTTYNWTPTAEQQAAWGVESDYTWAGWYSDAGLTTLYTFDKMPANPLALYGKFNAPTYTVSFNVNGGTGDIDAQTVEKYGQATYPATPTRANYTFTGWFTDEECTSRYDFAAPVTEDITLYAGWSPNPMTYTVHYLDEQNVEVYPSKTVTSTVFTEGQVITEQAVNVTGLIPDAGTKTVTMTYGTNEITFHYSARSATTGYTVQYVLQTDHTVKLHDDKVVDNIPGTTISVTEAAVSPDKTWMQNHGYSAYIEEDYYPLHDVQDLTLSSNVSENVLVFEYTNFQTTKLTVNFLDMDGNEIPGKDPELQNLRIGDTYYVPTTGLTGWTYDHVLASDGRTVTEYMINNGSTLTINVYYKKNLTITANNKEKTYDGQQLVSSGIGDLASVDGLVTGHTLTGISYDGSQTDVGTSATTPKNAVINTGNTTTGADYYAITYVQGTLTVNPASVTITIDPDRWTGNYYTGNPYLAGFTNSNKTVDDYVSISNTTYKTQYQETIWNTLMTRFPQGVVINETNAGYYTYAAANIFTVNDLPNSGNNYTIELFVRNAELEIKPVALTVTTGTGSKPYDGTALTNATATITGFVNNETATVTATGSQTMVGSSPNTYSIEWGTASEGNYTITEQLGTLEVTPAALTLTIKDRTVTCNGEAQFGYTITSVTGTGSAIETDEYTVTGLAEGDVLTVTYTPATGTTVDTYTNGAFATDTTITRTVDGEEVSVIRNYDPITLETGNLIIECMPLTLTVTGDTTQSVCPENAINSIVFTSNATLTVADLADGLLYNPDTKTISGTPTETKRYTVTTNEPNGCEAKTITGMITVNALPTVELTTPVEVCYNGTVTLHPTVADVASYTWKDEPEETDFITGTTPTDYVQQNVVDGFSKTITVKNNNGCTASATAQVTVKPIESANISGPTEFCYVATGETLSVASAEGAQYQWYTVTVEGENETVSPITGETNNTLVVTESGTYKVSVTAASGCITEDTKTVTVWSLPVIATPTVTNAHCTNDDGSVTLNVTTDNNVSYSCAYAYKFPATSDDHDFDFTDHNTNTVTGLDTAKYTVTVTDANGCQATVDFEVGLDNNLDVTITAGTQHLCSGGSFTVTPATELQNVHYQWDEPEQSVEDGVSGTSASSTTEEETTVHGENLVNNGTVGVTLTYTVTPILGICVGNPEPVTVEVSAVVHPTPVITAENVSVCPNATFVALSASFSSVEASTNTVTWSLKNGEGVQMATGTSSNVTNSASWTPINLTFECGKNYTYSLSYIDDYGCETTGGANIKAEVTGDINVPDDGTGSAACVADVVAPHEATPSLMPTVTDGCGQNISSAATTENQVGYTLKTTPDATPCGGEMAYVYEYKDCSGNKAEWTYTYTVAAPVLTVPETLTAVENVNACYAEGVAESHFMANDDVKDLCSSTCSKEITVTHSASEDVVDEGSDNCGWTVTRTYHITNGCSEVTKTMSVSGSDQTAPSFKSTAQWPNNITGQNACYADRDITGLLSNEAVKAMYEDCSEITVTSSDAETATDNCGWTITRTYTIKDACNNEAESRTMSVSGSDQTAPVIDTESENWVATMQANRTVTEDGACTYTVPDLTSMVQNSTSDNCTTNSTDFNITQNPEAGATITDTTTVTVTAKDLCTNTSEEATVTITVPAAITVTTPSQHWTYNGTSHDSTTFSLTSGNVSASGKASGTTVTLPNGDVATVTVAGSVTQVSDGHVTNAATVVVKDPQGNDVTCYYNITEQEGELWIECALVTVTADDSSKTVGTATDPTLTATVTGLVNNESVNLISYNTPTRQPGEEVGLYTITVTGDIEQGNYCVNYVNGTFAILPVGGSETVHCYSEAVPPTSHIPTAVPNPCGGDAIDLRDTVPVVNPPASNWTECEEMVTYTYKYKDCHGDEHAWVYTYLVKHDMDPLISVNNTTGVKDTVPAAHGMNAGGTNCVYTVPKLRGTVVTAEAYCTGDVNNGQVTNISYIQAPDSGVVINQTNEIQKIAVTVTATDGCGNSNDTIIYVKVPAKLQLTSPTLSDTVKVTCYDGRDGSVALVATGGTEGYNYSFNGYNYQESNQFGNLFVPSNPIQSTNQFGGILVGDTTAYVKDAHGCVATAKVIVQSPVKLEWLNVPNDTVVCCDKGKDYATVRFVNPEPSTRDNGYFENIANFNYVDSTYQYGFYPDGTIYQHKISYFAENDCDERDSKSFTITVLPNPSITFADPEDEKDTICYGAPIDDIKLNLNFAEFAELAVKGLPEGVSLNQTDTIITGTPTNLGALTAQTTYKYTVYVVSNQEANNQSCQNVDSLVGFITVNPQIRMDEVADQTVCHGTPMAAVTFTTAITDGTMVYNWTRDNTTNVTGVGASGTGNIAAATLSNQTATAQTVTFTVRPTYTNNGISCEGADSTFTVTVYPELTSTDLTSAAYCLNATQVAALSTTVSGGHGTTTYKWYKNGQEINGASTHEYTPATDVAGEYTYKVEATNECGTVEKTAAVTVYPQATLAVSNAVQNIIYGSNIDPVVITNTNSTVSLTPDPDSEDWPVGFNYSNQTLNSNIPAVGNYTFTVSATNENGCNTDNQTITVTVVANENAVVITSATKSWTYDGQNHTDETYTVTYGVTSVEADADGDGKVFTLPTGDKLTITATASGVTNVGTYSENNTYTYELQNAGNYTDVTASVGTLSINPKEVTVTAQSHAFTYTGTAQSWPEYDVTGLVGNDAISAVVTGSITLPSESPVPNVLTSYEFTTGIPGNYNVTTANGELTMTTASMAITITAASDGWTYDGAAHQNTNVTVTSGSLLEGDELVAMATGSVTNVSETSTGNNPIAVGYKIMHGEEDVTANYVITTQAGTLTITCAQVTVKADAKSKTYGAADPELTATVTGVVDGDNFTPAYTLSRVAGETVGEYVITPTGAETQGNYCVAYDTAKLTISQNTTTLTIASADGNWIYDGNAHTNHTYTVTYGDETYNVTVAEGQTTATVTLPTGDVITFTPDANATITHVAEGEVTNAFNYTITNADNEDMTGQYANVTTNPGTLTVNPTTLTITMATANKEYDGTPLVGTGSISGFVTPTGGTQETATFTVTGSQTTVGSSENTYELLFADQEGAGEGVTAVSTDYTLAPTSGTLTVSASTTPLSIASATHNWTYDSYTHTDETYTVTYGDQIIEGTEGQTVFTLSTGDQITITATAAGVTYVSNNAANNNTFTYELANASCYSNVTTTVGSLSISKKQIIISGEKSKNYDGDVLVANYDELTVTPALYGTDHFTGGTVTTESAEIGVYTCTQNGFQYVMDLIANQADFAIENAAGLDVKANYEPQFDVTLTIEGPSVTIDCGEPQTIIMKDCEENVKLVDLIAPELEVAEGVDPSIFTVTPSVPSGLNALTPGTYTVTWTVTDGTGTPLATCEQTVTVNYPLCDPIDYQGHTYQVTRIGSQCWLAENLRNTKYDDNLNEGGNIEIFRPVNDDESTVDAYGYLYSWYSAVGVEEGNNDAMPTTFTDECNGEYIQGACPEGWAVPSQADVNQLRAAIEDDASMLKDFAPQYWLPGANGVNPNSGFNAHAGGHYNSAAGQFEGRLLYAYFWESDSQPGASQVISAVISYYCDNVQEIISSKADLRPVRCVRKVILEM